MMVDMEGRVVTSVAPRHASVGGKEQKHAADIDDVGIDWIDANHIGVVARVRAVVRRCQRRPVLPAVCSLEEA